MVRFLHACSRLLLKTSFLAMSIAAAACSNPKTENPSYQNILNADVAPGVVLIDVLEAGRPEHYWQYEVRPATGLVRQTKEEAFLDSIHEDIPHVFEQPTGAIETCTKTPEADSLDGNYSAYCSKSNSDEFFVINKKTGETLYQWKPKYWRGIKGFAWGPNSRSVAFLNISSYYGKSPLELLSGLSGHPVPHDAVFLNILDMHTGKVTEYTVRRNVVSSFTRILQWSERE